MKRGLLLTALMMLTLVSYGRKYVDADAVVVSDTIYYSADRMNVNNVQNASYYRLLMKQGNGINREDVFKDYYMNGQLRAEGGYSFVDLSNDENTKFNGDVTTYYPNGQKKWHGKFVNGKLNGYLVVKLRDGGVAAAEFSNGKSKYDYFTVTRPDGTVEKHRIGELKSLL